MAPWLNIRCNDVPALNIAVPWCQITYNIIIQMTAFLFVQGKRMESSVGLIFCRLCTAQFDYVKITYGKTFFNLFIVPFLVLVLCFRLLKVKTIYFAYTKFELLYFWFIILHVRYSNKTRHFHIQFHSSSIESDKTCAYAVWLSSIIRNPLHEYIFFANIFSYKMILEIRQSNSIKKWMTKSVAKFNNT